MDLFGKLDHTQYYPIFHWQEWELWEFISEQKLSYPELYNQGFDRIRQTANFNHNKGVIK